MVVDAVIRHWVMVVATTKAGAEGLNVSVQDLVAYFYVEDRIVALPWPERLHRLHRFFDILTYLLKWINLRKNTRKMMSMSYQH